MSRPRKPENDGFPDNLYFEKGRFRYRRPTDGRFFPMGTDREAAIADAHELNAIYAAGGARVDRVLGIEPVSFGRWLPEFEAHLAERELSPVTLANYKRQIVHIRAHFAADDVRAIDVRAVAAFLRQFPARQANAYRALLSVLFRFAISEGLRPPADNPASAVLPRRVKVTRRRLTLEQWREVHALSLEVLPAGRGVVFQRALSLALHTLQRREDLAAFRFSAYRDGQWECEQIKTGARVRIALAPAVAAVVEACRDRVVSRHVLHYPFEASRRFRGQPITPDWLTKAFAEVRDRCPSFLAVPPEARPTFHEVRGLGAELYRRAGVDERVIQRLLGHTTLAMTEGYLSRHDRPFEDAFAGLEV